MKLSDTIIGMNWPTWGLLLVYISIAALVGLALEWVMKR